jgi:5-methylcytosine-specific restriction endonuclease McrA
MSRTPGVPNHGVWKKRCWIVIVSQEFCCALCSGIFPFSELELDHIKPLREGGKSHMENLRAVCHSCHVRRHQGNLCESKVRNP